MTTCEQLADLEVKFRRSAGNLPVAAPPAPAAAPAPVQVSFTAAPLPVLDSIDDYDLSESCVTVHSPKVGSMCVHKYVKGNKVGRDPIVKIGDKVKKGQTIAYIAQLGTHWPVEVRSETKLSSNVRKILNFRVLFTPKTRCTKWNDMANHTLQ